MATYFVNDNAQPTGEHEVHRSDCAWLRLVASRTDLGDHFYCNTAVQKAKQYYTNVDGCYYCSNACHNR